MTIDPSTFLEEAYLEAVEVAGTDNTLKSTLPEEVKKHLWHIVNKSESAKAAFSVILTSVVYKSLHPEAFEAVEVKHNIPISVQLIRDAFEKFKTTQVARYYLLSTANINVSQTEEINKEIDRIRSIHGCHVIANGVIYSLNYYLRLLSNTSEFIESYVHLIENDTALKFEHKKSWNDIISAK